MTFINWYILFGLAAVSIPILIHLFNRRKAKVIDWGAMQFLQGSLVNRKRRILVEELILMALRCLLIACLILAVARPFSPINSGISWLVVLPVILIASVLLAVATIVARRPGWRWLWIGCALAIVAGAIYLSQNEQLLQAQRWKSSTEQDVAIVIDGSSSMNVVVDGKTNFEHAVSEARQLIESLGPEDNVSFIIAGGIVENATPEPVNMHGNIEQVLDGLKPVGGEFSSVDALSAAASALAAGSNASKKVVLISDGQKVGWDADNQGQWQFVADTLNYLPTKPKVVSRFLTLPDHFQNACIASVEIDRRVVGTDRPVTIAVRVENTGFESIEPSGLQVQIDGNTVLPLDVGVIEPGESKQLDVKHRFEKGGTHTLAATLLIEDDLKQDNAQTRVVQVLESLPVLLVDGSGQLQPMEMATTFLEIALAPPGDGADENAGKPLVTPTVIAATDLADDIEFADYRVVVLADVPRLGAVAAERIAAFVRQGGGLLIAPGSRCIPEFYNGWHLDDGGSVLPAQLVERIVIQDKQQTRRPVTESFKHPALSKLLSQSQTDISRAVLSAYWKLKPSVDNPSTLVGALLDNGDPFLVETTLGRGRVAITASSLDISGSNLPTLLAFVPFTQELTYTLAAPAILNLNRTPAQILTIDLPFPNAKPSAGNTPSEFGREAKSSVNIKLPDGTVRKATLETLSDHSVVSLSAAVVPGYYEIELNDELSQRFSDAAVQSDGTPQLPFTIALSETESRLDPLTEDQELVAKNHLDYFRAANTEQMVAAVIGEVPGHELWKYLAIAAVLIVLAESFVTRWIAQQRKMGTAESVDFVSEGERLSTFQTRARELLETVRSK